MDNGVNRWVLDRPMLNSYMYKLRCAFHGHLMISDKLPVPFFVTSLSLCGRGAHIPTEFGANIFVIPQTLTLPEIQYGGRRRLGFSWKVTLARCGLMRVSCSNISHSRWDWNTFVLNVRLMTSCELTSGCIIGREHTSVSMALVFLHTKFGVINIFPLRRHCHCRRHELLQAVGPCRAPAKAPPTRRVDPCKNFVSIGWVVFTVKWFKYFIVQAWNSYSRQKKSSLVFFWKKNP